MKNKVFIPFLLFLLFTQSCGKADSSKGGDGTGMFEFPTQNEITITYNQKDIQVTDHDKIQEIIDLCKQYDWSSQETASYTKDDCDIWIDFNTNRAVVGFVSGSSNGMLNDTAVNIPDSLDTLITSIINS